MSFITESRSRKTRLLKSGPNEIPSPRIVWHVEQVAAPKNKRRPCIQFPFTSVRTATFISSTFSRAHGTNNRRVGIGRTLSSSVKFKPEWLLNEIGLRSEERRVGEEC